MINRQIIRLVLLGIMLSGQATVAEAVPSFPLTLRDGADRQVTLPQPARRLVAFSRGGLNILLALGGTLVGQPVLHGEPVPEGVQTLPDIGNVVTPNLEALMQVRPDLIVAPAQAHGDVAERLKVLRTPLYLSRTKSVADVLRTVSDLGALLDKEAEALALRSSLEQQLNEIRAAVPSGRQPRVLLLFGTSQTFFVIAPQTLAGDLLRLAGGDNVAATILAQQATATTMDYVPLSLEDLLRAEPEVIGVVSHGDPVLVTAAVRDELGTHPAWQTLKAVQNGRVHILPTETFSADPGPEFLQALRLLIEVVHGQSR